MTDPNTTPPTEQQLDEITARAEGIASQLSGWLRRFGLIAGYESIDRARNVLTEDVPALLADLRRTRDRVAELEAYAYGCDAEGCVLPHSSWCDAAKKTAAENDGCTCGKPWTGHPQPHAMHCWTVNPPRTEVEEMRKRIAELSAAAAPDATYASTGAPLSASQRPEVPTEPETATEAPEALLRHTEHYLSALHGSVARHDNLAANYGCAGCELRDAIRAQQSGDTEEAAR